MRRFKLQTMNTARWNVIALSSVPLKSSLSLSLAISSSVCLFPLLLSSTLQVSQSIFIQSITLEVEKYLSFSVSHFGCPLKIGPKISSLDGQSGCHLSCV